MEEWVSRLRAWGLLYETEIIDQVIIAALRGKILNKL